VHLDEEGIGSIREWDFKADMAAGAALQAAIDSEIRRHVCACCCRGRRLADVEWHELASVAHEDVLRADGPRTDEAPRHALTTLEHEGVRYCLSGEPSMHCCREREGHLEVQMCHDCMRSLDAKQIPECSLVRIDPGLAPPELEPLHLVELNCIAPLRVSRHLIFCKDKGRGWRRIDAQIPSLRGHVVAFANASLESICKLVPEPLHTLPAKVQVVLMGAVQSREQALEQVKRLRWLQVRFPLLM
jgi:hypothetical protein